MSQEQQPRLENACKNGAEKAHFVEGAEVTDALARMKRVYVVGHLEREQPGFEHIGSLASPLEIGITQYDTLTADQPHLHTMNTDIVYVLKGTFAVRILATKEVRVLEENGLCVIEPGLAYVSVARPGTTVLFVKAPGGNDKVCVDLDEASRAWIESYKREA